MRRFFLLVILVVFWLQDNNLWAETEAPSADELKAAERTIARAGSGNTRVTIRTSMGTIEVMLYDETPLHRDNFIRHVEDATYTGVLFHRVVENFMIQAGDPTSRMTLYTTVYGSNDAGERVPAEIRGEFFHHRGALAAARQDDTVNPRRESSGSQFYIVTGAVQNDSTLNIHMEMTNNIIPIERAQVYKTLGGAPHLDGGYTVFGRVTRGMRVVEKIGRQPTDSRDRPRRDIYIKEVTIRKTKKHDR